MFLTVVEGLWLKTRNPVYLQIYRFWLGIFAMAFGVGGGYIKICVNVFHI
jgi:cytochrome d ubiquinol oxidase subunit I